MVNYKNGKIYKITSPNTEKIYIGSTCHTLEYRLRKHINNYKSYLKGEYKYTTSYEIIKSNDFEIILLENVKCNNKRELHLIERKYIDEIDCVNKFKPLRSKKEWYQDNKQRLLKKQIEYQKKNKAKNKARGSKKINCECGSIHRYDNTSAHKKTKKHIRFMEQKNN